MPVRRFVARIQERSDGGLAKCSAEEMLRRVVTGAFGIADGLNERCERGGGTLSFAVRLQSWEKGVTIYREVSLRVAVLSLRCSGGAGVDRREDCGRQGEIWAGNRLLGERSQQREARRKA